MFEITYEQEGDVTVVHPKGRITMWDNPQNGTSPAIAFRDYMAQFATAKRPSLVVLKFDDVQSIDSVGLGQVLGARTRIVNAGGGMVISGLSERADVLMKVTKASEILPIEPDRSAAVKALRENTEFAIARKIVAESRIG